MKVTVLGCNGLYPANKNNTSGYLLRSENCTVVLDMGSGVFSALKSEISPEKVDLIFISHLHYDHVSDLGVYNYYLESLARLGKFSGKIKVLIKKCESAVYSAIAQLNYFELIDFRVESSYLLNDIKLNFFNRKHPVLTHGVTVSSGEKIFSYASDGAMDEVLEQVIKSSDLTLCHAPFTFEKAQTNKAHASALEVAKISMESGKRTLISHLLPDADNLQLLKEIENYSLTVVVEQGKTYCV